MAIDDPYDRTGQYTGGDTGPKVGGFAHGQQPGGGYVGDRRDHAVATMVGDGYRDNASGYAAILDSIENRIEAVGRFNGRGTFGNYGYKGGKTLDTDQTLESVVTARTRTSGGGFQFSNWSPKNAEAYGITQGAYQGKPVDGTQGWYDQALSVYDDYYSPQSAYPGMTMGGTYYQNKEALTARQAAGQLSMQREFGAMPVGTMGHVVTGPGYYGAGRAAYSPDWDAFSTMAAIPDDLDFGFGPVATGRHSVDDGLSGFFDTDFIGASYSDDALYGGYADFQGLDDPMAPGAYGTGYATPTDSFVGGYGDDFGFGFADDLGDYADFDFADDPMGPGAYGPATADFGAFDPMAGGQYGPATADFGAFDPMSPEAYGPGTAPGFEDAMEPGAYGPAYSDAFEDAMAPGQYGPATASWGEDPMAPGAYGTGYATPTDSFVGNYGDDIDFGGWSDDLGDYAEFTGTDDPMGGFDYGPATASWDADPMAGGQYGPATAGWGQDPMQADAYGPATASWSDDPMAPEAYAPAKSAPAAVSTPAPTPKASAPASTGWAAPSTATGPLSGAFGLTGFGALAAPQAVKGPAAAPMAAKPAPRAQAPARPQTTRVTTPAPRPAVQRAPQAVSRPIGRVGTAPGMNPTGGETFQRADRSVGDRGGAYGGHDAFGKNDPFGGLGFGGRGYADVVDSFDKAVGITRTVRDRQGNITGQASWSGNQAPNQSEFGIDGVRSDGRGTGDTGMGDGGSRGDGSYSESSGYNDNNPQGIL